MGTRESDEQEATLKAENSSHFPSSIRFAVPFNSSQNPLPLRHAINDSLQIVGTSQNSSGSWRAFIAAPDSAITASGDLGVGAANAINSSGEVVGLGGGQGFIWTSASGRRTLMSLVPSGSGWNSLDSGEAINDNGVIVGYGYMQVGQGYQLHGFRLTPP